MYHRVLVYISIIFSLICLYRGNQAAMIYQCTLAIVFAIFDNTDKRRDRFNDEREAD